MENALINAMETEYVHLVGAYAMEIFMVRAVKFLNGLIIPNVAINVHSIKVYVL
jgi:hypothetical protein